jgi:hypothetical protein
MRRLSEGNGDSDGIIEQRIQDSRVEAGAMGSSSGRSNRRLRTDQNYVLEGR